jgi:hypothetical protein
VVIAVGDRMLAIEAERYIRTRLERAGVEVVEITSIPGFESLLDTELRPAPETVQEVLRPHVRFMVPLRIEVLGQRQIYAMGQTDTVYQARVTMGVVDLEHGRQLGRRFSDKVEFTQLNADGKIEGVLRRPATGLLQHLPRN